MATGLKPLIGPASTSITKESAIKIQSGNIVTSLMCSRDQFDILDKPKSWSAFFVVRDPRDLLVSKYFSDRYSHPVNEKIDRLRTELDGMSESEGLQYTYNNSFVTMMEMIKSWTDKQAEDGIPIYKFEELTGQDNLEHWVELFDRAGFKVRESTIHAILKFYRKERLSAPKNKGQATEKYRSGKPGDWVNYLDIEFERKLNNDYGEVISRLGYQ